MESCVVGFSWALRVEGKQLFALFCVIDTCLISAYIGKDCVEGNLAASQGVCSEKETADWVS